MGQYAVIKDDYPSYPIVCRIEDTYSAALHYIIDKTHGRPMNGYRISRVKETTDYGH